MTIVVVDTHRRADASEYLPGSQALPTTPWSEFFDRLVHRYACQERPAVLVVSHILPDMLVFAPALEQLADVALLMGKPKSIHPATRDRLRLTGRDVTTANRVRLADPTTLHTTIARLDAKQRFVLVDVGGYFAPGAAHLAQRYGARFAGIVEDTENGHRRYARARALPYPVISVARSPLKEAEDHLVGQSIVSSAETLLRGAGRDVWQSPASVIGYGKVGRSIAATLQRRGVPTVVFDRDPIRATWAAAHGHHSAANVADALRGAATVFCATGNRALGAEEFPLLARGAHIVSATSSDDELDFASLASWSRQAVTPHITRFASDSRSFHLVNGGDAVNFVPGASTGAGPFIHLVQGEILAAVSALARHVGGTGITEVTDGERAFIAATWLDTYRRTAKST